MSTLTTFLISDSAMICTRPPSCCNGPAKLVGNDTCRWMTCVASWTSNGFVAVNKAVAAAAPWHWRRCAELPGLMPVAVECLKNQSGFSCENSKISTSTFESWGKLQNTCFWSGYRGRVKDSQHIQRMNVGEHLWNIASNFGSKTCLSKAVALQTFFLLLVSWNPRVPPSMARLTSWNHHLVYESSNQFQWEYSIYIYSIYSIYSTSFVHPLHSHFCACTGAFGVRFHQGHWTLTPNHQRASNPTARLVQNIGYQKNLVPTSQIQSWFKTSIFLL